MEQRAYSPRDAAKTYGLGTTTIYRLMKDGRLRYSQLGERRIITDDDMRDLIERHRVEVAPKAEPAGPAPADQPVRRGRGRPRKLPR